MKRKEKIQKPFDASCLILGFTGSIGSGCSFLAEGIYEEQKGKAHYYKLSKFLREIAHEKEIEETTEKLQLLGDELRGEQQSDGKPRYSILVEKCIECVKSDDASQHFSSNDETVILIDGLKNCGEIKYLRHFPNFYLISVHADKDTRKKRTTGVSATDKRFKNEDEFNSADKRDEEEEKPNGQQVKQCNYMADIIVINDKNIPDSNHIERQKYFQKFINDYIYPMQKVRKGEVAHDRPPKTNETLMTLAYCVSKRSSCLKRKVGAVIAYARTLKQEGQGDEQPDDRDLQFQVISTGYNDVPAGKPCIFLPQQKCQRDCAQEEIAKEYKYCPNCGEAIPDEIECPYCKEKNNRTITCQNSQCKADFLSTYQCPKCNRNIFSFYLPGKQLSLGKLLDRCRALHAEENAILGLAGISKTIEKDKAEMVLYTTTFPCNLCANKIVVAGIKKVYYAEPYPIKEAYDLLINNEVLVERFEGIKSNAYFRLYS